MVNNSKSNKLKYHVPDVKGEIFFPPFPVSFLEMYYDLTFKILFYATFGREGLVRHCDALLPKYKIRLRKSGRGVHMCSYTSKDIPTVLLP